MKKIINVSTLLVLIVLTSNIKSVKGQNNPIYPPATLPSGSGPGAVTKPNAYNNSPNTTPTSFNYTRVYIPRTAVTTIPEFDNTQSLKKIHVKTTYGDGFSNPIMAISRNGSFNDIVSFSDQRTEMVQGNITRSVEYLPYAVSYHSKFQASPFSDQESYYLGSLKFPNEGATAYSKTLSYLDNGTPTVKSFLPGRLYVGEEIGSTTTQHFNAASEVEKLVFSSNDVCIDGFYAANELIITKTVTADGEEVLVYKDKAGRLIRKEAVNSAGNLITYYLYDDFGRLTHVLPPKAYNIIGNGSNCIGVSNLNRLSTANVYNKYGSVIYNRVPNRHVVDEVIYDRFHMAVLTRSPESADEHQWKFVIHDKRGRVIMTGIYDASNLISTDSRAYWDGVLDGSLTPVTRTGIPQENTLEYWLMNRFSGYTYPATLDDCEILLVNYYDDYDALTQSNYQNLPTTTPTGFDDVFQPDYLSGPDILQPKAYMYAHGKLVATQVRIEDNGNTNNFISGREWITSVMFYDIKGRLIQTQTQNPWNTTEWDISTIQYNWAGQKIQGITQYHSWATSTKPTTKVYNSYEYDDNTGRLIVTKQKVGNSMWQTINEFEYDDVGKVMRKWSGNYEAQDYTYTIRGQLSGINEGDLMGPSATPVPDKTFFEKLSYDIGYMQNRNDGKISGFTWRIQGGDPMTYGYRYDDVGRLVGADFNTFSDPNQMGGPATWNNQNLNYTLGGVNYDENGNITALQRWGQDANNTPNIIDDLTYTYIPESNQIDYVDDAGVASSPDIIDFDDQYTSGSDYSYDKNGNIINDNNKNITIAYDHNDAPLQVSSGADVIKNIYSGGQLLQKEVFEGGNTITYRYWGPFVFKDNDLHYMKHSEGRARYDNGTGGFTYDYYVKDHLGNVRTVVEGQVSYDQISYHAGFELLSATVEESVYTQIGDIRDLSPSGTPDDQHSGKLNGGIANEKVGAALLVHSMAGDKLNLSGYGFYNSENVEDYNMYATSNNMLGELVGALTGAATGGGGEGGEATTTINNLLTTTNYNQYNTIKNNATDPNYPRAYLNYLVFDENFDLQAPYCKVVQLKGTANSWQYMQLNNVQTMPTNGYILVYFSNESHIDVFVDNQALLHYQGNLQQTQHYYPYGLAIATGSNGVVPENKHLYQAKELQTDLGLQLHDFHARQYDAQLGRFMSVDPANEFPSGYTGMGDDPANLTDPTGMYVNEHSQSYYTAMQEAVDAAGYPDWETYERDNFGIAYIFNLVAVSSASGTKGGPGFAMEYVGEVVYSGNANNPLSSSIHGVSGVNIVDGGTAYAVKWNTGDVGVLGGWVKTSRGNVEWVRLSGVYWYVKGTGQFLKASWIMKPVDGANLRVSEKWVPASNQFVGEPLWGYLKAQNNPRKALDKEIQRLAGGLSVVVDAQVETFKAAAKMYDPRGVTAKVNYNSVARTLGKTNARYYKYASKTARGLSYLALASIAYDVASTGKMKKSQWGDLAVMGGLYAVGTFVSGGLAFGLGAGYFIADLYSESKYKESITERLLD